MISANINGIDLKLKTHPELFSPNSPDQGTLAMLSTIPFKDGEKVLDLGCGYGFVGVLAAKTPGVKSVVLCDIDPIALNFARENALLNNVDVQIVESDGFAGIEDRDFTLILSNPPYHADFAVPKRFIEEGFNHLQVGGRLGMVVKRRPWYENKMRSVFGGVRVTEADGYFVLEAEKRRSDRPALAPKAPSRKHQKRAAVSAERKRRSRSRSSDRT